jgi:hypothetical protein
MTTIVVPAGDVAKINSEIVKVNGQIQSAESNITYFQEQLNGKPAEYLYSIDDLENNPSLASEQRELFPAVIGALTMDDMYMRLLFDQLQPVIDPYEAERRGLDGKYPLFGVFNEALIQAGVLDPVNSYLFNDPPPGSNVMDPVNPGETFGGTGLDPINENAKLVSELSYIATLLTGPCQVVSPPASPCQTAHSNLIASLLARYNPVGPAGILVDEETALNNNPDLALFPSNPLPQVLAEQTRVNAFRLALVAIPIGNQVPAALLTPQVPLATARKTYITGTRVPEMDSFLNVTPGYYNTRFDTMKTRIGSAGMLREVKFLQDSIVSANTEKTNLIAQRGFLESLLP